MSLVDDILTDVLPSVIEDIFGDSVTYTHKPGNTIDSVTGVLVDPSPLEGSFPGGTTAVDFVKSKLSLAPVQGDEVTIGVLTYTVFDVKSDSVGPSGLFVRVFLRKK